jgi:hypothetical protein
MHRGDSARDSRRAFGERRVPTHGRTLPAPAPFTRLPKGGACPDRIESGRQRSCPRQLGIELAAVSARLKHGGYASRPGHVDDLEAVYAGTFNHAVSENSRSSQITEPETLALALDLGEDTLTNQHGRTRDLGALSKTDEVVAAIAAITAISVA